MVFTPSNLYHRSMEKEMIMEETISVTEIVSIGNSKENNMARIAAMEEEFSHTIDPILRMYNAAMNLTAARLNIIKDEFEFSGKRVPIHHIDTRLKSSKSILGKLEKKGSVLPSDLDGYVETHWIDHTMLRNNEFQNFIVDRAKKLLSAIEGATGRTISGKDSEEVQQAFGASLN